MNASQPARQPSAPRAGSKLLSLVGKDSILLVVCIALLGACSSVERSRSLEDASVSATVTAQQVCSNCHGIRGVSASPNFPNLAAQPAEYLETQLKSFRSHGRSDPAGFEYMWGLSAKLTDAQIAGLAAYFSAQAPAATQSSPFEGKGKLLYQSGIAGSGIPACASCHGKQGEGAGQFPRLAGQHADYVIKQLKVFQRTDERPAGAIMKPIVHSLTEENIRSIAEYVESIQPLH